MKIHFSVMAVICLLLTSNILNAQVDMEWDIHGVGFKVPNGFVIKTNNEKEFTAANDEVFVTIIPVQNRKVTKDDLADAVVEMAKEMKFDELTDADELEIDDFEGYYVRGVKSDYNAIVIALLDTESSTNLLVVIGYSDDWEDEALLIANSFYAYDN
jgi:hypothetical protein